MIIGVIQVKVASNFQGGVVGCALKNEFVCVGQQSEKMVLFAVSMFFVS
jgi:hypothetical protein